MSAEKTRSSDIIFWPHLENLAAKREAEKLIARLLKLRGWTKMSAPLAPTALLDMLIITPGLFPLMRQFTDKLYLENIEPQKRKRTQVNLGELEPNGVIGINLNQGETERRFTVAHEIGHWVLGSQVPGHIIYDPYYYNQIEQYCDILASCLAIPEFVLARWLAENNYALSIDCLEKGARVFQINPRDLILRLSLEPQLLDKTTKGVLATYPLEKRRIHILDNNWLPLSATPSWGRITGGLRETGFLEGLRMLENRVGTKRFTTETIRPYRVPERIYKPLTSFCEYKVYSQGRERYLVCVFDFPKPTARDVDRKVEKNLKKLRENYLPASR